MRWLYVVTCMCFALVTIPAHAALELVMRDPIVHAKIDLAAQRMHVFVDGEHAHTWKISSGTQGYATPNGKHFPYRMHKMWRSRKYQNAPMPYSVFYNGGFAVHGTKAVYRLGRPASHGCVRLRTTNAKKFYHLVRKHGRMRTTIEVSGRYKWRRTRIARRTTARRGYRYANKRNRWHRSRTVRYYRYGRTRTVYRFPFSPR